MTPLITRDIIVRAVTERDGKTLGRIVAHFADCEQAKQILRAKGYGASGTTVGAAARLVPPANAD